MEYKAPDGNVIQSSSEEPVVYLCNVGGPEGIYTSYETKSANNAYGIQQIKIVREVTETDMIITITESTPEELQAYLDEIAANTAYYLSNQTITI